MARRHVSVRLIAAILTLSLFAPTVSVSAQNAQPGPITNDDVIQMVQADLSENLILSQIADAQTSFDFSTPELIRLSTSGVSDTIIAAMQALSAAADTRPPQPVVAPVVEPPDTAVAAPSIFGVSQAPRNAGDEPTSLAIAGQQRENPLVYIEAAETLDGGNAESKAKQVAWAQTPTTAVTKKTDPTIYIGPQIRDGFIDTDSDIVDSIKDIKSVFRKRIKNVRIVRAPEEALLHLYVNGRGKSGSEGLIGIPIGTTTMLLDIDELYVNTLLRVGDYEKEIVGVEDQWRDCAGQVVNKLKVWLSENDAKVQELWNNWLPA